MSFSQFVPKKEEGRVSPFSESIRLHKKAGTINRSAQGFVDSSEIQKTPGNIDFKRRLSQRIEVPKPAERSFFDRTAENVREVSFNEFIKQVPKTATRQAITVADTIIPAIANFVDTTGSIFGEGLAYAFDKNVREQYAAGNLHILPTITETTIPKLAKYTLAAGIETAIFRSLPGVAKMKLAPMTGVGALEGVGFAISEGMARDLTPEEIIKNMPLYGVTGAGAAVLSPYLLPLLKSEIKFMPNQFKNIIKGLNEEPATRQLGVESLAREATPVPISTKNTRYQEWLRNNGYEPYTPTKDLPVIKIDESPAPNLKGAIDVEDLQPPKVSSPEPQFDPKFIPDKDLPVIDADTRKVTGGAPEAPVDPRDIRVVPLDQPTPQRSTPTAPAAPTPSAKPTPTPTPVAQPQAVVEVPSRNLPVGDGVTRNSRLEERMIRNNADPAIGKHLEGERLATYQQVTKADQTKRAAKFVEDRYDDALAVVRGQMEAPDGLLDNAVALALAKHAELTGDAALAIRLASLRSTRAGQEISMLTEADPLSVVASIESIIKARQGKMARAKGGGTQRNSAASADKAVTETKKDVTDRVMAAEMKIEDAEKLLNDILC